MWNNCKRIVCIRADNMGDVIMTTPALRALKETFGAHITLLTSSMAKDIVPFIPEIDDLLVADLPWVKAGNTAQAAAMQQLIRQLQQGRYDAAIVFTVYSQSALPAAMLAMLAGIPKRLAYCRENPYELLTDWVPDPEPYRFIQHQVERDLKLVNSIGAVTANDHLSLQINPSLRDAALQRLHQAGIDCPDSYVIFHPGVSEAKRQYPTAYWRELAQLVMQMNMPIFVTGTVAEKELAAAITDQIKTGQTALCGQTLIHNIAGLLNIGEFIALIDYASLVVSVNTATVHIAAARQKPVIVLYALTNPQHTPWKTHSKVFSFSIPEAIRSRNEVVSYVIGNMLPQQMPLPCPVDIAHTVKLVWQSVNRQALLNNE